MFGTEGQIKAWPKTIEQRIIERYDYDISDIVENRDDVIINGPIIHVGDILCILPKMNGTRIVSIFDSKCNISNQNGALDMETPDNHPIAVGRSVIFFSCLRALKTARQATPTKSLEEIELCARFEAALFQILHLRIWACRHLVLAICSILRLMAGNHSIISLA